MFFLVENRPIRTPSPLLVENSTNFFFFWILPLGCGGFFRHMLLRDIFFAFSFEPVLKLVRPGQTSCILMRAVPKPNQIGWVLVPKHNQSGQFYVPICFLFYFFSLVMNNHWVFLSISRFIGQSIRQTYSQSIRLQISLNVYKCLHIGQVKSEKIFQNSSYYASS